MSPPQRKVARDIAACRTSVLGGRLDVCEKCGDERQVFHSCRNRHCPLCQALTQARWVEHRMARLLPVDYFHVVFTVPDALLASLALHNREVFFNSMFAAASQTLLALGNDTERLGAQLGLTAVLHTWTRDLRFHPHLHCIVTGGGLTADGKQWRACNQSYLFPARVLSKLFRGKLLALLKEAFVEGRLILEGVDGFGDKTTDELVFSRLLRKAYKTRWVSYAKKPFAGPEVVYQYLGRYTHRVGISNHRLVSVGDNEVVFRTRDEGIAKLHPIEFIRRFLTHVLPPGFVKIRHYGLLAPGNVNTRLVQARTVLAAMTASPTPPAAATVPSIAEMLDWKILLLRLTGVDLNRCRKCGGPVRGYPLRPTPRDTS